MGIAAPSGDQSDAAPRQWAERGGEHKDPDREPCRGAGYLPPLRRSAAPVRRPGLGPGQGQAHWRYELAHWLVNAACRWGGGAAEDRQILVVHAFMVGDTEAGRRCTCPKIICGGAVATDEIRLRCPWRSTEPCEQFHCEASSPGALFICAKVRGHKWALNRRCWTSSGQERVVDSVVAWNGPTALRPWGIGWSLIGPAPRPVEPREPLLPRQ